MIDIKAVILSPLLSGSSYLHGDKVTGLNLSRTLARTHINKHVHAISREGLQEGIKYMPIELARCDDLSPPCISLRLQLLFEAAEGTLLHHMDHLEFNRHSKVSDELNFTSISPPTR